MQNGTIEKTIHIAAPREMVWDYLTKKDQLAKWFHGTTADLSENEAFQMLGENGGSLCSGSVLEMRPFDRLAYSFTATPMNGMMTTVEWTLTEVPGGTHLALNHSGFGTDADSFGLIAAFDKGWDGHLIRIREL